MSGPTALNAGRLKASRKASASDVATSSAKTQNRPSLSDFATTTTTTRCRICAHQERALIDAGLRDGHGPGLIARYLRAHCAESVGYDTLRKSILRHQESNH